jgi:hypothetical protein
MQMSEHINDLAAALAKAQAAFKDAAFNKINPHFKNKYADLTAVRHAVQATLAENNLAVTQLVDSAEGRPVVVTTLLHSSGQYIATTTPILMDKNSMQALGSGITYARRYALAAICGIASDEDDDAEAAESETKWQGPLNKTALQKECRAFALALTECNTAEDIAVLLEGNKPMLDQLKVDLPQWWHGDGGDIKGAAAAIESTRDKLEARTA